MTFAMAYDFYKRGIQTIVASYKTKNIFQHTSTVSEAKKWQGRLLCSTEHFCSTYI